MNSTITNISVTVLKRALNIQEQIEELGSELHQLLTSEEIPSPLKILKDKKRKMSAAARRLISEAQKARWAKAKGDAQKPMKKGRRKMSATAKAKISAAAKARWAKVKAAEKSKL